MTPGMPKNVNNALFEFQKNQNFILFLDDYLDLHLIQVNLCPLNLRPLSLSPRIYVETPCTVQKKTRKSAAIF